MPIFVYPLGLAIALVVFGLICAMFAWKRLSFASLGAATLWLWIASTPVFAGWALGTLERKYPAIPLDSVRPHEVAIVLGGAVGAAVPPRHSLDLMASSDRVLLASRLYRAGKVERILVTGGRLPWLTRQQAEAELIRSLLIEWGVPAEAIEIAADSRNTFENALEIAEIRQQRPFDSALLVTSATHMPRALAVFAKAGIPVSAATTDVRSVDNGDRTILNWLPQADALAATTIAIKEWIGLLVYRQLGYA